MRHKVQRIPNNSHDLKSLKKILPYLSRYKWRTILALSSLVVSKFANVGVPLMFKDIVDALDTDAQVAVLLPVSLVLAYGLMRAGSALFNELRDAIFSKVRYSVMQQMSVDLLAHLHNLSLRFHLNRKTGAITRDMERGTNSVNSLMNLLLFNIVPTLVEILLITIILLFNYDSIFVIITLATVILYVFFTMKITQWRIKFRVLMNNKDSQASNHALDSMLNFETVKYFNNEQYELNQYKTHLDGWRQAGINSQTSMSALNFGQATIIATGVTLMMIFAAKGVVSGQLSLGDLVLVNTFMLQLFIPLGFLGIVYSQVKHALSDIHLMFKLFDEKPDIQDLSSAKPLSTNTYDICFNKIRFEYDKRVILNDLSFTVPNGQKVAIIGASGSGKSTIARLLFRFYEPQSGTIKIGGQMINKITQNSLRQTLGIVPQDTILFNNTIEYNIRYSNINATEAEIINAAKQANIHDFIKILPEGYETIIGERGLKLSGGEKQRIAIARAILKHPNILVLDEATSSLDSISEQKILSELDSIAHNYTTLVIAHRLSTIVNADKILVLDQGKICESGTHNELLKANGFYANLWHKQQK